MLGTETGFTGSSTRYAGLYRHDNDATESNRQAAMPVAGTIRNLRVNSSAAVAGGAGASYTITVRKNGANTGVTCAMAVASKTCNDTTHSVSFAAGDLISFGLVPTSAPTNVQTAFISVTYGD